MKIVLLKVEYVFVMPSRSEVLFLQPIRSKALSQLRDKAVSISGLDKSFLKVIFFFEIIITNFTNSFIDIELPIPQLNNSYLSF